MVGERHGNGMICVNEPKTGHLHTYETLADDDYVPSCRNMTTFQFRPTLSRISLLSVSLICKQWQKAYIILVALFVSTLERQNQLAKFSTTETY
jgi:hypothetical protein